MKKTIATFWVFAIGAVFLSHAFVKDAKAQAFSQSPLILHDLAAQLITPEAIARYLWKNFTFETDQRQFGKAEYWQSPEEFIESGKGDCEDFALLASALLSKAGKKSFLLNIYGHRYAHTICVFVEDGKYHAIDVTTVKRYGASSIEELMTKFNPDWKSGAIVARSETNQKGRILKKFEREAKISRAFSLSL